MSSQATVRTSFCKDETENLLVVEGKNDCNGIYQIAAQNGFEDLFGIWEGGSDIGALERFGGLLLSSRGRPKNLGIVLDCDADENGRIVGPARRWEQIKNRLENLYYDVPTLPRKTGTIIGGPDGYPKVGVWLMPDNETDGMFEDFLLPLAPIAAVDFARECARTAKDKQYGDYKPVHESKATAHTYLAWQDEPGRPLGLAIKARMFDLGLPAAKPFVDWLRALFEVPPI